MFFRVPHPHGVCEGGAFLPISARITANVPRRIHEVNSLFHRSAAPSLAPADNRARIANQLHGVRKSCPTILDFDSSWCLHSSCRSQESFLRKVRAHPTRR